MDKKDLTPAQLKELNKEFDKLGKFVSENYPPVAQFAIVTASSNIKSGCFWGFTNERMATRYEDDLKGQQDIAVRKLATVLLTDLAKCFLEEKNPSGAATVLEYGSEIGSDISTNYTLLGECYKELGEKEKFDELYKHVQGMDFIMKNAVLKELDEMKTDQ